VSTANLTESQEKWFASVRASLERDTGRSMAEWVEIARACPASGLQNRASLVLDEAFPPRMDWSAPERLIDTLWGDPVSREIYEAFDGAAMALQGTVRTARKGYTAWSRKVQFAAARPVKGGKVMVGLAVSPESASRLQTPRSESWSERLTARTLLATLGEVDVTIHDLLISAWRTA
jgi:hypothetical protein